MNDGAVCPRRPRRVEGRMRGPQRMADEDGYRADVLPQVSAAIGAPRPFSPALLKERMAHCVVEATRKGGAEADIKIKEAADVIARLVRSQESQEER